MTPFGPAPRRLLSLVLVVLLFAGLAACAGSEPVSFDPQGPCVEDGRMAGAYPALEAAIPAALHGAAPDRLDSGRNCTPARLGTLAGQGIEELRFAGGLWETGNRSGATIAVFEAPGLTPEHLAEFYETGARSASKTENVSVGEYSIGRVTGSRLDTLNDESFQSIVVIGATEPDRVRVVLVASDIREVGTRDAHDEAVDGAVAAALGIAR